MIDETVNENKTNRHGETHMELIAIIKSQNLTIQNLPKEKDKI
jgi:hypothetical protein